LVAILFSEFLTNVKGSIEKILTDFKEHKINSEELQKVNENPLIRLGARIFSWSAKDKNKDQNKSILKKKVRFEKDNIDNIDNKDNLRNPDTKESELSESDSEDDEVCEKVSRMFGFSDDEGLSEVDTDNETDPDTDRDDDDEQENLKDSLKIFMKENMEK
jgi:hypothetical protein